MKHILFPYEVSANNKKAFVFTMELARLLHAEVHLLTVLRPLTKSCLSDEERKKDIHGYLLQLQGYYQCYFNDFDATHTPVQHQYIAHQSFEDAIVSYLAKHPIDLVVAAEPDLEGIKKRDLKARLKPIRKKRISTIVIPIKLMFEPAVSNRDFTWSFRRHRVEDALRHLTYKNCNRHEIFDTIHKASSLVHPTGNKLKIIDRFGHGESEFLLN